VLKAVNSVIERVLILVAWPMFAIYIVAIFTQVIARNYLQIPITWLDEIARMLFLWTIMLGSAVAVRRRVHYDIEIFPPRFVQTNTVLKFLSHLVTLVVILVMLVYGWQYADMSMFNESEALEVPWAYTYVSMPIAAAAMASFWIETVIDDLRSLLHHTAEA